MAETNFKLAFRLIPIHPDDWHLLWIHWNNQYYVNLYLPFWLRMAPFLFSQLLDALEWVLKQKYGLKYVLHLLDNFFMAEPTLLRFFMLIHAPVVSSKTVVLSQALELILFFTLDLLMHAGETCFIQFCLSNRLMSQEGDILPALEGTLMYFAS